MGLAKTLAVGVLALASINASALEIVNGAYGQGKNVYGWTQESYKKGEAEAYKVESNQYPTKRFVLNRNANRLQLRDLKRNILYTLDIGASGAQEMPAAFFNALRSRPERLGSLGGIIKNVNFVNVQESNDSITADVLVDIGTNSASATVKLSASLKARELVNGGNDCGIAIGSYSRITNKQDYKTTKTTCYTASIGENVELVSLNAVGMKANSPVFVAILDLALKMAGGQFYRYDDIVRTGNAR